MLKVSKKDVKSIIESEHQRNKDKNKDFSGEED